MNKKSSHTSKLDKSLVYFWTNPVDQTIIHSHISTCRVTHCPMFDFAFCPYSSVFSSLWKSKDMLLFLSYWWLEICIYALVAVQHVYFGNSCWPVQDVPCLSIRLSFFQCHLLLIKLDKTGCTRWIRRLQIKTGCTHCENPIITYFDRAALEPKLSLN